LESDQPFSTPVVVDVSRWCGIVTPSTRAKQRTEQNMSNKNENGTLRNYKTGEAIRPATEAEKIASEAAAERDGGAGVIVVDGVSCYVD